jgi:predicted phosphate transport protein (TIGR00153 family)
MLFGKKKDDLVSAQILDYVGIIGATVSEFRRMIHEYIDWDKHFKEQSRKVHDMEHEADIVRRKIERAMFEGAFLPAYREDYISLLEVLDRVANKAEDAADTLYLMRPDIPEAIRPVFKEIADITVEAFAPIPEGIRKLLAGESDISALEELVEGREQAIDKLQFDAIRTLFKDLNMAKADALLLKIMIDQICDVSDKIENVTDAMAIIAIKRRLA